MKLAAELEAFRDDVRGFLGARLPDDLRAKVLGGFEISREESVGWHRTLFERGWGAPTWPAEYGGAAWSFSQQYVFEEECHLAGAPLTLPMGPKIVGPILISAGTQEQRRRFLPPILDGGEFWCQGFSETGAGSDLASLRCRAVRDGDAYVVNGSKIWTSFAHWADWCLLLVRTDDTGAKQQGITILLVDMKAPGVRVQPIITLDGLHVVNEVFFDEVVAPVGHRIGEEGAGWAILKSTIGHERVLNGSPGIAKAIRRRCVDLMRAGIGGPPHGPDQVSLRRRLAMLDVRLRTLEAAALRMLDWPDLVVRPEASLLKVRGTELQQDLTRLLSELSGPDGLAYDPRDVSEGWRSADPQAAVAPATPFYLFMRKASISSGTNEIQRDIIAKSLLG